MKVNIPSTKIKILEFTRGMDTNSPEFSTDPRSARQLINFEPILPASGIQTVEGYQRFAGGPLATDQQWWLITLENCSYEVKEYDVVEIENGNRKATVLLKAQKHEGEYTDGSALSFFPVFFEQLLKFQVGEDIYFQGNKIGTVKDIQPHQYPSGYDADIVDIFRKLWKYYAETYILPVPGDGPIRGVFQLKGEVYALRDDPSTQYLQLYRATRQNTWERIEFFNLDPGGQLKFKIHNFGDGEKLYGVTGKTKPFIFDGQELVVIDTKVPEDSRPTLLEIYNNQLFLFYPDVDKAGSLLFSAVGDPTDFETTSLGAGEIKIPFKVTNLVTLVEDNLAIMGDNIYLLYKDGQGNFGLKQFARNTNILPNSIGMMLNLIFASEASISQLSTTNKYGNFELNNIAARNSTLVANILQSEGLQFAYTIPHKNQYRLVCGRHILVLTFITPELILFSRQVVPHYFTCISNLVTHGEKARLFYGSEDGFVFKVDSGYTFDNEDIQSLMITPIISIEGSPQIKNRLRKLMIPGDFGSSLTLIGINYNDVDWRRWATEVYAEISRLDLNVGYYDISLFDTFYWANDTASQKDNTIEVYLHGTTPTIVLTLYNRNRGLQPSKFDVAFLQYTPRSRVR